MRAWFIVHCAKDRREDGGGANENVRKNAGSISTIASCAASDFACQS